VIALRQRKGRTRTFVARYECEGVEIAKRIVSRTAVMHADEASHWDALHAGWTVNRINIRLTMPAPIKRNRFSLACAG